MMKVVVRLRKFEPTVNRRLAGQQKKYAKEQAMFDTNRRYVTFVWPIVLMEPLVSLACKKGVRPNTDVQEIAERHVANIVEGQSSCNKPHHHRPSNDRCIIELMGVTRMKGT